MLVDRNLNQVDLTGNSFLNDLASLLRRQRKWNACKQYEKNDDAVEETRPQMDTRVRSMAKRQHRHGPPRRVAAKMSTSCD
jgi:hypothetical protein